MIYVLFHAISSRYASETDLCILFVKVLHPFAKGLTPFAKVFQPFAKGVHTFYQGATPFAKEGVHKPFVKVSTHLLPRCPHLLPRCPHLLPRCSYLLSRCSHEGAHTFCKGVQPFDKVPTPKGHSHPLADCQARPCTKYICMSFVQTLVASFPKLTLWPMTDICPTKDSAL